jgi:hypothetical protein
MQVIRTNFLLILVHFNLILVRHVPRWNFNFAINNQGFIYFSGVAPFVLLSNLRAFPIFLCRFSKLFFENAVIFPFNPILLGADIGINETVILFVLLNLF